MLCSTHPTFAMNIVATPKSAALTGAWTVLGMTAVDTWEKYHPVDAATHNVLFLIAATIFLFIPAAMFVAGPQYFRFGFKDLLRQEYWLALKSAAFRALCWFLGATAGLVLYAIVDSVFIF